MCHVVTLDPRGATSNVAVGLELTFAAHLLYNLLKRPPFFWQRGCG